MLDLTGKTPEDLEHMPGFRVFRKGTRVELHPALDLWMRGARYGTVTRIGKRGAIYVKLDNLAREHSFRSFNLTII